MTSIKERTRLSRALNDIDLRIHSKLGTPEIMQAALEGFVAALDADAGDIKLVDGDSWIVSYEYGFGPEQVGVRLSRAEAPVAERVAALREPVNIVDYLDEPAGFYVGFPRTHGLRATLAVPLIVREEVAGCLFAWMQDEPREFTPGEIDFARRMATSVALALENSRLYEAERLERRRAESAERSLARELGRTNVLLRASDELTTTTDPNELLERLANVVLDATGIERVFINLIDARRKLLTPKIASGGLLSPSGRQIPFDQLSATALAAIATKRTQVLDYDVPDIPEDDRAIARANAAHLVLFVPLLYQGEIIGHISLDQPSERYDFSPEQIRIVESIAAQAAVALHNARSYQRDHRIAETLQQAILTPPEPLDALEVAWLYQPALAAADVGGDFYDVFGLGDGHAAIMIGDVAGKGIDAARLTTLLRDGARAYLLEERDPAAVLTRLNTLAYRFMPAEKFATAFLGVLEFATGDLAYASVGHPPPVVVGPRTHTLEPEPGLIGALEDAQFAARQTTLDFRDKLVLFTDGVTEARQDRRMLGEAGVFDTLAALVDTPVAEIPQALLSEVLAFSNGRLRDDVVIVAAARRPAN